MQVANFKALVFYAMQHVNPWMAFHKANTAEVFSY